MMSQIQSLFCAQSHRLTLLVKLYMLMEACIWLAKLTDNYRQKNKRIYMSEDISNKLKNSSRSLRNERQKSQMKQVLLMTRC